MNLMSLKEKLLDLGKKVGLQVQEETKDFVALHSQLTAKDYFDNSIYFKMVVFASGTLHLFFTFDEIERTYDNLYLINAFNESSPWFRAYISNINDKDFLELHYSAVAQENEEQIINSFGFLMNSILGEETLKYLRPLLNNDKSASA